MRLVSRPERARAFQNELVAVFRSAEAVEQALQRVARQNEAEIVACTVGDIQELLADRCGDIPGIDRLQMSASMYGLITFATRQTFTTRFYKMSGIMYKSRRRPPAITIAKGRCESEPIPRDSAAGNRLQLATTPGAAQCSR